VADGLPIGLPVSEHAGDSDRQGRDQAVLWSLAAAASFAEAEGIQIPAGFHKRPRVMEARRRMAYRASLLVLVLSRFNGQAANLHNVHLFMWATRTARTRNMLSAWWSGRRYATSQMQRLDPDLQVTAGLAVADGLVGMKGQGRQRIFLTDKGRDLARAIDREADLLSVEKRFLASFPRLSDAAVARQLGVNAE
jgi:hypothetical protein